MITSKEYLLKIKDFLYNYIIVLTSLGLILPFLVLSFFNHPSQDDYCQVDIIRRIGYWEYQAWIREHWGGRFTSYALSSLVKVVENNLYVYKLFPIALFFLSFWVIYFFVNQVCRGSRHFCLKVTFLVLLLYIIGLDDVAESFYWMSSAFTYQIGNIIAIFLAGVILIITTRKSYFYSFLGVVSSILLIGTNEVSMVLADFSLFVVVIYSFAVNKKVNYQILLILCVALIASYIVISAEGNYLRSDHYSGRHVFGKSILKSLLQAVYSLCLWSGLSILTVLIIYRESLYHNVIYKLPNKNNLKLLASCCFIITSLGFFVGFWATGETLAHRARSVVYLFFLLTFISVIFIHLCNYRNLKFFLLSRSKTFIILILGLYFSVLFSEENINDSFVDLMKGYAVRHSQEIEERRLIVVENREKKIIELPPLKAKPKTLFVSDITKDPNNYFNQWYAQFLGINAVKLKCD